jgi:hypothetical protein
LTAPEGLRGLDSGPLQDYLRANGLAQVLDTLLATNAHQTWPRAASAELAEKASAVWADALRLFVQIDVAEEIDQARGRYEQDPSDENLALLKGLKEAAQRSERLVGELEF